MMAQEQARTPWYAELYNRHQNLAFVENKDGNTMLINIPKDLADFIVAAVNAYQPKKIALLERLRDKMKVYCNPTTNIRNGTEAWKDLREAMRLLDALDAEKEIPK